MKLFRRHTHRAAARRSRLVTAYLEDAMPRRERRRLEAHLAACPHCAAYVEQIRLTIALTGASRPSDLSAEALDDLVGVFRAWSADADAEALDRYLSSRWRRPSSRRRP